MRGEGCGGLIIRCPERPLEVMIARWSQLPRTAVPESTRDYSNCSITVTGQNFSCGGSATGAQGTLLTYNSAFSATPKGANAYQFGPGGSVVPFTSALYANCEAAPSEPKLGNHPNRTERTAVRIIPSQKFGMARRATITLEIRWSGHRF